MANDVLTWWDGKWTPEDCIHPSTEFKMGCGDANEPIFFSLKILRLIAKQPKPKGFVIALLYGLRASINSTSSNVKLISFNVWATRVRLVSRKEQKGKNSYWIVSIK